MTCLRRQVQTDGTMYGFAFWCPGCCEVHSYVTGHVKRGDGSELPIWQFNGDMEKPTFTPSLRITWTPTDTDGPPAQCCHLFIKAGKIEFCGDCTHELKGKTVELPPWPYAAGDYHGVEDP
jgi:hypothetical protein